MIFVSSRRRHGYLVCALGTSRTAHGMTPFKHCVWCSAVAAFHFAANVRPMADRHVAAGKSFALARVRHGRHDGGHRHGYQGRLESVLVLA